MTNTIAQTAIGLERIQKILDADNVIPERPGARDRGPLARRHPVRARRVRLRRRRRRCCATSASPSRPGQHVGVVGPTGSGKSTIVSLIPRFYDPTGGRISIDGVELSDYTARRAARADRLRPAGHGAVPRHHARQHRLRPARRDRRGDRRRREARQRRRVHRQDAARLRLDDRRARRHAVGRPAAAHRHRPRGDPQRADPDPRRADGRARHRVGEARDRGARAADGGPHGHHDRASPRDDPQRGQDRRAEGRRGRRGRHATTSFSRATASSPSCIASSTTLPRPQPAQ